MVTYSISKTNANIGETITLSRSGNLNGITFTFWIIDLQPSDYSLTFDTLLDIGKEFEIQDVLSTTVTIDDNHTIAHTLTPISVSVPTVQYINSIYTTPIYQMQGDSMFTMNIGEPIEVNFNRNIYNQLKFLINRWTKGKEDKTNKVTSISSSSTNTQYPSAKAVNNAIKPKTIQNGDDLDDYYGLDMVGEYYCPTDTIAQSLTNSPVDIAFTMKVEYTGYNGNGVKQTVSEYAYGSSYFRTLYYDTTNDTVINGGWKKWYENTNWQNLSFSSGYGNYDSSHPVRYKRMNKIVHIEGIFKNTNAIASGSSVQIGTITDTTCRPPYDQYSLQQGSNKNFFLLVITSSGAVKLERYGTNANAQTTAGAWLHCNMTWFVD